MLHVIYNATTNEYIGTKARYGSPEEARLYTRSSAAKGNITLARRYYGDNCRYEIHSFELVIKERKSV